MTSSGDGGGGAVLIFDFVDIGATALKNRNKHERHKFYLKLLPVRLDVYFAFFISPDHNSSLFKTPIKLSLPVLDVRLGNTKVVTLKGSTKTSHATPCM